MHRSNTRPGGSSATSSAFPSRTASPSSAPVYREVTVDARTEGGTTIAGEYVVDRAIVGADAASYRHPAKITAAGSGFVMHISRESQTFPVTDSVEPRFVERSSADSQSSRAARPSLDSPNGLLTGALVSERGDDKIPLITLDQHETTISQMHSDYELAKVRRQEERHNYLERIDALQAKLQYLTKEAAEIAKRSANDAEAGSIEEELAKKDEKIALLMEEGQKLSQTELKHVNTIRKLRARSIEDEKCGIQNRRRVEDLEKVAQVAQERAKRAEVGEREETERVKALQRVINGLEKVKSECEISTSVIADLRQQAAQAKALNEANGASNYKSLFETEKRLTVGLRDEISNARIEKQLSEERHRAHIKDIVEKTDRKEEKARAVEQELRSELTVSLTSLTNHTFSDHNSSRYSKVD